MKWKVAFIALVIVFCVAVPAQAEEGEFFMGADEGMLEEIGEEDTDTEDREQEAFEKIYLEENFKDSGEAWQQAVICLHDDFHVFLYGLIPLGFAALVLFLVCWWFYCVFIRSV